MASLKQQFAVKNLHQDVQDKHVGLKLTRTNVVTQLAPRLDLFNKHAVHQHPPIYMKNQQTK